MTKAKRQGYATDVSDEEWEFCAPYLCLMRDDAPQREYSMRELFNALRWQIRAGCPWRRIPNDLQPWDTVYRKRHRRSHGMPVDLLCLIKLPAIAAEWVAALFGWPAGWPWLRTG